MTIFWAGLMVLSGVLGWFTLIVPAVMGYMELGFGWVVAHAFVASLFAGTGGLSAKILGFQHRRTSFATGVFWMFLFPWGFAIGLGGLFYYIGGLFA